MKIMIAGAYGKVGQHVIAEAAARGFEVTGVAHHIHTDITLATGQIVIKDATTLTTGDVAGYDAIVDAVGVHVHATRRNDRMTTMVGVPGETAAKSASSGSDRESMRRREILA